MAAIEGGLYGWEAISPLGCNFQMSGLGI